MTDIARLANVSVSTVSRALANHPRLSVDTRNRINELARSLNYSVNVGAQIMRGKAMQTVAVVFPYHAEQRQHFKDPFFMALIGSIGDALIDSGHSMLIAGVDSAKIDLLTQAYDTGQAIGTIVLGQEDNHRRFNAMALRGMPFVVWGARMPDQLYCTVGSHNMMGGEQATAHLLAQGARRVAFIGDRTLAEVGQRHAGYLQAHRQAGLEPDPALYCGVPFSGGAVRDALEGLLRDRLPFDAVFACADTLALAAVNTLRANGLRVPEQVRVIGYDDIPLAAEAHPPLSTIRQAVDDAGKALVRLLMAKLAGEEVDSLVLPTTLVQRAST